MFYILSLICEEREEKTFLKSFLPENRTRMFTLTITDTVPEFGQQPNHRPPTTISEVTVSVWILQTYTSIELLRKHENHKESKLSLDNEKHGSGSVVGFSSKVTATAVG